MRSHATIETERTKRIRHLRDIIREAVALHRQWLETHGTDDDTDNVSLAEILPGVEAHDTSEVVRASLAAGFPVGKDEDGLTLCIGGVRRDH